MKILQLCSWLFAAAAVVFVSVAVYCFFESCMGDGEPRYGIGVISFLAGVLNLFGAVMFGRRSRQ